MKEFPYLHLSSILRKKGFPVGLDVFCKMRQLYLSTLKVKGR